MSHAVGTGFSKAFSLTGELCRGACFRDHEPGREGSWNHAGWKRPVRSYTPTFYLVKKKKKKVMNYCELFSTLHLVSGHWVVDAVLTPRKED